MLPTLDTALGFVFAFLLLSLVCSALREAVGNLARHRSKALKVGLDRLLGPTLAHKLCTHSLVSPLSDRPTGPSDVPAQIFSTALLDLVREETKVPDHLRQALGALETSTGNDRRRFQAALEDWFNSTMDAVSSSYKRRTHVWLAVIGLGLTIAMNADSIRMAGALFANSTPRVASPLGWPGFAPDNTLPWKAPWTGPWWSNARLLIQWHWAGWLITAVGISLGAPFWFDLLKQFPSGAATSPVSRREREF